MGRATAVRLSPFPRETRGSCAALRVRPGNPSFRGVTHGHEAWFTPHRYQQRYGALRFSDPRTHGASQLLDTRLASGELA